MRHQNEAPLPGLQEAFQPQKGRQVEVVSRLIQQQEIRLLDQRSGKQQSGVLTAAKRRRPLQDLIWRKTHLRQQPFRLPALALTLKDGKFRQYRLQQRLR